MNQLINVLLNILKYLNISNMHKLIETSAASFAQFKITVIHVNTVGYVLREHKSA